MFRVHGAPTNRQNFRKVSSVKLKTKIQKINEVQFTSSSPQMMATQMMNEVQLTSSSNNEVQLTINN